MIIVTQLVQSILVIENMLLNMQIFVVLSFHPVKHFTTGEGGAILTNNKSYYKKLNIFREHGMLRKKKMVGL